ncbi:hypothetical protein GGS23DRAFT_12305 [Durotheca rogersii]|uniref:uncharacterized protein n=1 Tax=Durotheca rogersii TaxID=419775 RepID=UPI00222056FE|nr:uncharacterized protein GGS23DRAFT_12305 [Durotheca rogersii]KAI5868115.1 hypothetical protein GGS23DRAFT_12305 [Durotheca rogersii]
MKAPRYSTSRQKACQRCSTAKARCDRKAGRCTRCALRGLSCTYLPSGAATRGVSDDENVTQSQPLSTPDILHAAEGLLPTSGCDQPTGLEGQSSAYGSAQPIGDTTPTDTSTATSAKWRVPNDSRPNLTPRSPLGLDTLDFSCLELLNPINVDDISNRWLNSFVPIPGQKVKEYPASITAFIYRILKSYAAVTVRGRGVPPFVHFSQTIPALLRPPLSTCLSLVRVCDKLLPGSEGAATDVLQREMDNLYEQHGTYDDVDLLAAFQAYLVYSLVLFFILGRVSDPFLRQAMMNLQELACSCSRGGLVCVAEQQRACPRWEAWVVAEAKRRTLFTMYLFDSVLLAQDGLPTFLGTELRGLSASASKSLWSAQTRYEWETTYSIYLADWPGGGLRIDELWPTPPDLDAPGILERRNRVDQWLENVDEFGTMLYAVTSCTHGG